MGSFTCKLDEIKIFCLFDSVHEELISFQTETIHR